MLARGETSAADAGKTKKEQILEYIRKHPGAHLRQIKRELNIPMGVIQYHLHSLERERMTVSRRKGLYKRFYPNLVFGENQQEILNVLSQETERDLLLYLIRNPNATQKQLSEFSKISAGTINWHMKRLLSSGLVATRREGQFVRYRLNADSNEILKLLRSYHPSVWETWADRFADALDVLSSPGAMEDDSRKQGIN